LGIASYPDRQRMGIKKIFKREIKLIDRILLGNNVLLIVYI